MEYETHIAALDPHYRPTIRTCRGKELLLGKVSLLGYDHIESYKRPASVTECGRLIGFHVQRLLEYLIRFYIIAYHLIIIIVKDGQ